MTFSLMSTLPVIAYHLLDENVPLWESLKTASKVRRKDVQKVDVQ